MSSIVSFQTPSGLSVTEGNSGSTPVLLTVLRRGDTTGVATVNWTTSAVFATGSDFVGGVMPSGILSFQAGENSKTITINVVGDTVVEGSESLAVTLSSPIGTSLGALSDFQTSVTIVNDDGAIISVTPGAVLGYEGTVSNGGVSFTVTRSGDTSIAASANWVVTTGLSMNLAAAADFPGGVLPSGTVSFAAGETTKVISIPILADATSEATEEFFFTLSNASAGAAIGTGFASGVILNDEGVTTLTLGNPNAVITEGNAGASPVTFTVTRTGDPATTVSANWAVTTMTVASTFVNGADFAGGTLPSGVVSFSAGEMTKTITVNIAGDTAIEPSESFFISLSTPTGGAQVVNPVIGSFAIPNDDGAIFSIGASGFGAFDVTAGLGTFTEGNAGSNAASFLITRSGDLGSNVSVDWRLSSFFTPSISANGGDFVGGVLPGGTVTFGANETSKRIDLAIQGDTLLESTEFIVAEVTATTAAGTLSQISNGVLAIRDDDNTIITLGPGGPSAVEGNAGTTPYTFTVTRSGNTSTAVSATWTVTGATTPSNPASGNDFVGGAFPTGTVTFSIGETSKTITVNVLGDTVFELAEGFDVTLSAPTGGAVLFSTPARGTIQNDDGAMLSFATGGSTFFTEGNAGNTLVSYTINRTGDLSVTSTAIWTVSAFSTGPSSASASDFAGGAFPTGTVTFTPGQTSQTVSFNIAGDTVIEGSESFSIALSAPSFGTMVTGGSFGTIGNDDGAGLFVVTGSDVTEGSSGTTLVTFTIGRNLDTTIAASADWAVIASPFGVSATNADFVGSVFPSGTVSFAAGETSKTVTVQVLGDMVIEPNEAFQFQLFNPSTSVSISTPTTTRTILNDDGALLRLTSLTSPISEGNSGTSPYIFTVTRSGDVNVAASATWTVAGILSGNGVAATASDFLDGIFPTGTVSFAAGETSKTITVNVVADTVFEANEAFTVSLSNPSSTAEVDSFPWTETIRNDDGTVVGFGAGLPPSVAEGNSGSTPMVFNVTRVGDISAAGSANWTYQSPLGGLPLANASDFVGGVVPSGTVNFAAGASTATITVNVAGDTTSEPNEAVYLTLISASGNATIGYFDSASGTIVNDDGSITIDGTANADTLTGGAADELIRGFAGNDSLIGNDGNDTLEGGDGFDTLVGGNGNDSLNGGAGEDVLVGSLGNDTLSGGVDSDNANYASLGQAVTVTLDAAGNGSAVSASAGTDLLFGIERIWGSGFGDSITVNSAGGFMRLSGLGGNDTIAGPTGGSTTIFADYLGTGAASVVVNLLTGTANDGLGGTDTLVNIRAVRATAGADSITGSNLNDRIAGRGGNDTLDGGAGTTDQLDYTQSGTGVVVNLVTGVATDGEGGTDSISNFEAIWGTNFNDSLTGNAGNNEFYSLQGNDTITGGGGQDRVYFNAFSNIQPTQGVFVELAAGIVIDGSGSNDRLSSIERVTGTDFVDTIFGGAEANRFNGRAGNDTLDGGLGGDYAEYFDATSGVTVNLTTGTASDGQGGTDTLLFIENVIGSIHGDSLTGVAQVSTWSLLRGGRGNDTLTGIVGQFVAADFSDQMQGMTVNLGSGTVTDTVLGTDTLVNIRGAFLFGNFNDTITGTAFNDVLSPSGGNDLVDGSAGVDTVAYGGSETNTLNINLITGIVQDGDGGTDTLSGIENVSVSYSNDTITGSAADNVINPNGGADVVDAGAGTDTLDYSLGFSDGGIEYTMNEAGDRLPVQGMTINLQTGVAIDFSGATDSVLNFENAIGNMGDDSITGTTGDNILKGGGGNDTLVGGAGTDTAVFSGPRSTYSITRDSVTGTLAVLDTRSAGSVGTSTPGDGTDTLRADIEVLRFSDGDVLASSFAGTQPTVLFIAALVADLPEGQTGTTAFTFTVTRSGDATAVASAAWAITGSGGSPASANDFVGVALPSGTVSFAAGQTSRTITVDIQSDMLLEANEGFTVTLSAPIGATISTATANGSIRNDDAQLSVAGGAGVLEGNSGSTALTFSVTRSGDAAGSASASWTVAGSGGAPAIAADFVGATLPGGTVQFAAGEISKTITVNVQGDTSVEGDEGVTLTLSAPSAGVSLGTSSATRLILNDDITAPVLSIAALSAEKVEGQSGATPFTFTVTRAGDTSGGSSATWRVTSSNGTVASDFVGGVMPSGTVNFAAGQTSQIITVNVQGDNQVELQEWFVVTLSSPVNATLGVAAADGGIDNDDTALNISGPVAAIAEGQSGSTGFTFTATRTGDISGIATAAFAVTGSGTNAASAADFVGSVLPSGMVTFAAGQASQTITVNVAGEILIEQDESFTVTLSNPSSGMTLGSATAIGTIGNDDANTVPQVTALNVTVAKFAAPNFASLFTASDPNGDTIQSYQVYDGTGTASSGRFVVAGVEQAQLQTIDLTPTQLTQTVFRGGSGVDLLWVRANDGQAWSAWTSFTATAPVNTDPVVTAGPRSVNKGATTSVSSLFTYTDAERDAAQRYEFWDGTPGGGSIAIGGTQAPVNQAIPVTAAQLSSTTFRGMSPGTDNLFVRANDGLAWSNWAALDVTVVNRAPTVTAPSITTAKFAAPMASSLFTAADADLDSIQAYQFWDGTSAVNSGSFTIGGVAQAAGQAIDVSALQLSQAAFRTGSGADNLFVRASDGTDWSAWAAFTVTAPVNAAPVMASVVTGNQVGGERFVGKGAVLTPGSLFSVTDANRDTVPRYEFWDGTAGNGVFSLGGVTQAANVAIGVTAAQLGQLSFRAASVGTDVLYARAFDGLEWSNWASLSITGMNSKPVVTASNVNVAKFAVPAASTLFNVTDADSDAIQAYQFWDSTTAATSGSFVVAGVVREAATTIDVSAGQLPQTSFRSGAGADQLWVRASDGTAWSEWVSFNVTAPSNTAPVVTAPDLLTAAKNATLSASSLFTFSDANNDTPVHYEFWDSTPDNGRFRVGLVDQAANAAITVSAAQLGSTSFITGLSGSDQLWVRAFDGFVWSDWDAFTITVPNRAPSVTAGNQTVAKFAQPAANTLASATDPDNDAITAYQFWDGTAAANSGSFVVGGVAQAALQNIDVTSAQLGSTVFRSGSGADSLWVRANDGTTWSDWVNFTVTAPINTDPSVTAASQVVARGANLMASSLFNYEDATGDAAVRYQFWDGTPGQGSFRIANVAQAFGVEINVAANQLGTTSFAAANGGSDSLWVRANDGISWSNWVPFTIDAVL